MKKCRVGMKKAFIMTVLGFLVGMGTYLSAISVNATTVVSNTGDFIVTGGSYNTDYTYDSGSNTLTILKSTLLTIQNVDSTAPTQCKILINKDVSANLILAGVNIDVADTASDSALMIADDSTGDVTIALANGTINSLKSGCNCAALQKNGDGETIGTLVITGDGTLYATGGEGETTDFRQGAGAGIGGGNGKSASGIVINGGTIIATGGTIDYEGYGQSGAGIGGGYRGDGSNITITGGKVTAIGGYDCGAGIGGGYYGDGSNIIIRGGSVTAIGEYGTGIGGGCAGDGDNIVITGGSVYADANSESNAIGGSMDAVTPTNGSVTVTCYTISNPENETVTINGKEYQPFQHGIPTDGDTVDTNLYVYLPPTDYEIMVGGEPYELRKEDYMETKFTVTGTGVKYGVDYVYPKGGDVLTILTDKPMTIANTDLRYGTSHTIMIAKDVSANITLAGVDIDVVGHEMACPLKIADNSTGNVTITLAEGTENILLSSRFMAGIEKNGVGDNIGRLEITGSGKLYVEGGEDAAGIGSGQGEDASNILISGGILTIYGGDGNSSLGADGVKYGAAAIGGSSFGFGSNITISGGCGAEGSDIFITGGSVLIKGGEGASAIGGGAGGNGPVAVMNGTRKAYPFTVVNPNQDTIKVDGKDVTPVVHTTGMGDYATTYNEIYIYLTAGEVHTIQVGDGKVLSYRYDESLGKFVLVPTLDLFTFEVSKELIYDKTAKMVSVSTKDADVGVITIKYYKDGQLQSSAPVTAGTYTVKIDVAATDTYAAVTDLTHDSWTYTIEQAQLSIVGTTATERNYDGTDIVEITSVALDGIQKDDDVKVDVKELSGIVRSAVPGTYTDVTLPVLTLTGKDIDNYVLIQPDKAVPVNVTIRKAKVPKGKKYLADNGSATYKITKSSSKNGTAEYVKSNHQNAKKVSIPATVKIGGISYKVTGIAKNAFKNNKKITKVTIGKNVKQIGKKAFYNCKNLKNITIKTEKLTAKTVGKNAFKGIHSKAKIKVPKSKLKSYRTLLKKPGVGKKVTIKKY